MMPTTSPRRISRSSSRNAQNTLSARDVLLVAKQNRPQPLQRQVEAKDIVASVFLLRQHAEPIGLPRLDVRMAMSRDDMNLSASCESDHVGEYALDAAESPNPESTNRQVAMKAMKSLKSGASPICRNDQRKPSMIPTTGLR